MGKSMAISAADVPVPEMGPDVYITFDLAALEAIEEVYPDHWVLDVEAGLAASSTSTLRDCLNVALRGAEVEETLDAVAYNVLAERVLEAIGLSIYGPRRWAQVKDFRRANELSAFFADHWVFPLLDAHVAGWPGALRTVLAEALERAKTEPPAAGGFDALARRILDAIGENVHKAKWPLVKKEAGYA